MSDRAAEYRAKLEVLRQRGGRRWRTPAGLRDEIGLWAAKQRSEGHSVGAIAAAIGLSESTLAKWVSQEGGPGELRRVRLAPETPGAGRPGLVVVTPEGYRLEGLSIDEAVDVLRRL